jgi:hypothetical protein
MTISCTWPALKIAATASVDGGAIRLAGSGSTKLW